MGMQKKMVDVEVKPISEGGLISTMRLDKSGEPTGQTIDLRLRQGCFIGHNGKRVTFRGHTRHRRGNIVESVTMPEPGDKLIVELFEDEDGNIMPKPRWGNATSWIKARQTLKRRHRRSKAKNKYVQKPASTRAPLPAVQAAALNS